MLLRFMDRRHYFNAITVLFFSILKINQPKVPFFLNIPHYMKHDMKMGSANASHKFSRTPCCYSQ